MKRICVVIINYKTPELVLDCISSLREQLDWDHDHIVVVDNCSGGNDVSRLEQGIVEDGLGQLVTLVTAPSNGGFSSGNNIGIAAVSANYYLLANGDTLFRSGAIAQLLRGAEEYPEAGMISPRLEWPDGRAQISCFRFHSPISELITIASIAPLTNMLQQFDVPLPVTEEVSWPNWISFACVLVRRQVVERVGPMDEGYFMYYEDADYCRQARQAGFLVMNWPLAHVVHLRGQSSGLKKMQHQRKRLPSYHYQSRARYFRKFYGPLGLVASNLCWLVGRFVSGLRELLTGKERTVAESALRDIWQG
ncbi:MAG: glycosyltransferase family 2 protein [Thermodesulfobacteriota bacterium]